MASLPWTTTKSTSSLFLCLLLSLLAIFFFSTKPTLSLYTDYLIWSPNKTPSIDPLLHNVGVEPTQRTNTSDGVLPVDLGKPNWGSKCDLYNGTWVKDEEYPIYQPNTCPYVDEAFSCQANGRHDSEYLKWRWKPHACHLPRFNATDFLERLKDKRLMLVGDSMNRNQFESILCLLWDGLSDKSRMYETHGRRLGKGGGYYVFRFEDYNCTVEYVLSHFLVREGTRINDQGNSNPTLSIDQIDKSAGRWKLADILVFNTGHWWAHGKTARGFVIFIVFGKTTTRKVILSILTLMQLKHIEGP